MAEVSMVAVAEEASMAEAGAPIVAALESRAKAAPIAVDPTAEEVTAEAAHRRLAAAQVHPRCALQVVVRQSVVRQSAVRLIAAMRIFGPPSTMASGIRSVVAPVRRDLRAQPQAAIPPVPNTQP